MKREDLKAKGLTDEQIDFIMAENGKDVEAVKQKLTTAEAENKTAKEQLAEANKQIESFKGLDIDGVKKAAEEWKAKAETAQTEAQKQIADLKFGHALDTALAGEKAKNAKAVRALLNTEGLKYNEADGSIIGLKEQLETIKKDADYLFESDQPTPRIVGGTNGNNVTGDPLLAAVMKGAGLQIEQGK
jgi:hypothetical protein